MNVEEYENIYDNEGKHFFYVANHAIVLALINKNLPSGKGLKILDVGCGTGLLANKLAKFGSVVGLDISTEALKFARKRRVKTILGSADKLPFRNNTFDILTSIDVIYHKRVNDQKALKEFYRVLAPGGILILRVPANKWLNSHHDSFVHTRERYTKNELTEKLLKSKFNTLKLSYVNSILLPIAVVSFILEKFGTKNEKSGVKPLPKLINLLLTKLLLLDSLFLQITDLPFGLGLIAVSEKPLGDKIPSGKKSRKN